MCHCKIIKQKGCIASFFRDLFNRKDNYECIYSCNTAIYKTTHDKNAAPSYHLKNKEKTRKNKNKNEEHGVYGGNIVVIA